MTASPLKIVFSGMVAGDPHHAGATWAIMQYVLGLREMGHDVYLVEPLDFGAEGKVNEAVAMYFKDVVEGFMLEGRAILVGKAEEETLGDSRDDLVAFANSADLLINVSGMLEDPEILEPIPRRLFLDLDPAFLQIWHSQGIDMRIDAHTDFATVGLAIGSDSCDIPTLGRRWMTTLPPVVLSEWDQVNLPPTCDAFTTVANWRGYGSVEHNGEFLGQKAHSLRDLFGLPKASNERFVLALGIHPDERSDLEALRQNGWELLDPMVVAGTPESYRDFIGSSTAEFGLTKSGYVKSRCGWFSDRSVCYLAAGRPVLAQDTGFSTQIETGAGIVLFNDLVSAVSGVEEIRRNYDKHRREARRLAEDVFDSRKVLTSLVDRALS